jgi:hypothetical protein
VGRTFNNVKPEHLREKHDWIFRYISEFDWGVSVTFGCKNPGCPTTISLPLNIEEELGAGVCLNVYAAIQAEHAASENTAVDGWLLMVCIIMHSKTASSSKSLR